MVVDTDKGMSAFFYHFGNEGKPLETGGNKASTFFIDSQQNQTELNRIKRNRAGLKLC